MVTCFADLTSSINPRIISIPELSPFDLTIRLKLCAPSRPRLKDPSGFLSNWTPISSKSFITFDDSLTIVLTTSSSASPFAVFSVSAT